MCFNIYTLHAQTNHTPVALIPGSYHVGRVAHHWITGTLLPTHMVAEEAVQKLQEVEETHMRRGVVVL